MLVNNQIAKNSKQQGFVSIIVATVLMVLLTLMTIGFVQLMQREQRQALDRQLSKQAFYAAETGVNDFVTADSQNKFPGVDEKFNCDQTGPIWGNSNGVIDPSAPEVGYTCVQFDKTPSDLVFTDTINTENSKVFLIESSGAANVSTVTFAWKGPNGETAIDGPSGATCPNPAVLPASFSSYTVGMLRIDLIKVPANFTRADLIANTASVYLLPKTCGPNTPVVFANASGANSGAVANIRCNNPVANSGCIATINGLSGSSRYVARVKSIYNDAKTLTVTATDNLVGSNFEFKGAQILVDSTGRASDVLQRIEVRISQAPDVTVPEAVIESNGVCKLITVVPGPTPFIDAADSYQANGDCL